MNLLVGWALLVGLHQVVVEGKAGKDPVRAAGLDYRRSIAGPLGMLAPSRDLLGRVLWALVGLGLVVSLVLYVTGARFVGTANAVMLASYLLILWRDHRWLKNDPGFQAAIAAAHPQDL